MRNSAIALSFAMLIAVGCGKDDKPGNSDAYQVNSNACSEPFIADMNGVATQAAAAFTRDQAKTARSRAVELKTKYAGVKCKAEQRATGKTTMVNADETLDGIIRSLDTKIAADDGTERGGPGAADRD